MSYIEFELVEQKPKTAVYHVLNKHHGDVLATVKWYAQWRQYCTFFPTISHSALERIQRYRADADRDMHPEELDKLAKHWEGTHTRKELFEIAKARRDAYDFCLGLLHDETVFSAKCMLEIVEFIRKLMEERKRTP